MVRVRLPQLIVCLNTGSVLPAGRTLCCRGSPAELWAEQEKAQCDTLNRRRVCVSRRMVFPRSLPTSLSPSFPASHPQSIAASLLPSFVCLRCLYKGQQQLPHRLSRSFFFLNFIAFGCERLSTDSFSTRWHVVFTIRRCVARPRTVIRTLLSSD